MVDADSNTPMTQTKIIAGIIALIAVSAFFFYQSPTTFGADVSNVQDGVWGISLIEKTTNPDGSIDFTTVAARQRHATKVEMYYPPLNETKTDYTRPYALVRLVGNVQPSNAETIVLPDLAVRFNNLTLTQRNVLKTQLSDRFPAYQFRDYDGTIKSKQAISDTITTQGDSMDMRALVTALYSYMGHSIQRPRAVAYEWHNTEYTDNFTTDTSANWTTYTGTAGFTYDSANGEMDFDGDNNIGHYYNANNSGSMEHEAQLTGLNAGRELGPGVRMQSGAGNYNGYGVTIDQFGNYQLWKVVAGTRTQLELVDMGVRGTTDWTTQRLAASGGNGANVVLNYWWTNHGTTKPSDPGWIGVDASPNETYTDTAADRLDDSSLNLENGVLGRGNIGGDSNSDFFKLRAISDRGGAAAATVDDTTFDLIDE